MLTDIIRTPKCPVTFFVYTSKSCPTLTEQQNKSDSNKVWMLRFYFSHGTMGMSGSLLLLFNTYKFRNVYTASSNSLFLKSHHLQKICIGHKMGFIPLYHFCPTHFTTTNNYWGMFEVHAETHVGLDVKW